MPSNTGNDRGVFEVKYDKYREILIKTRNGTATDNELMAVLGLSEDKLFKYLGMLTIEEESNDCTN